MKARHVVRRRTKLDTTNTTTAADPKKIRSPSTVDSIRSNHKKLNNRHHRDYSHSERRRHQNHQNHHLDEPRNIDATTKQKQGPVTQLVSGAEKSASDNSNNTSNKLSREILDRISNQVIERTKQLGLFDDIRMKLLERIEARGEFAEIRRDFDDELQLFCHDRADLSEPRSKLRQQLNDYILDGESSMLTKNLNRNIRHIIQKYKDELKTNYQEKASSFLAQFVVAVQPPELAENNNTSQVPTCPLVTGCPTYDLDQIPLPPTDELDEEAPRLQASTWTSTKAPTAAATTTTKSTPTTLLTPISPVKRPPSSESSPTQQPRPTVPRTNGTNETNGAKKPSQSIHGSPATGGKARSKETGRRLANWPAGNSRPRRYLNGRTRRRQWQNKKAQMLISRHERRSSERDRILSNKNNY